MTDWIKHWTGPIAAPVNLLINPVTNGPDTPASWIQLPGVAGSSVVIKNARNESVTLTSTTKVNTWVGQVREITSSSGAVTAGAGPLSPPIQITGADGEATLYSPTTGADWPDPDPTTIGDALDTLASRVQDLDVDAKSIQAQIELPYGCLASTGAPLAVFADGASAVPGLTIVDGEAQAVRWNNHAAPAAIVTGCAKPQDLDEAANVVYHALVSKVGATLADATSLTLTAFEQNPGALHDADADFGGATDAVVGDAASKTLTELTLAFAHANISGPPGGWTITVKPTAGLLGTDDFLIHRHWLEYKRLPRTA